ncbi:hypothetical protein D3C80_921380 [compost metagenome]
MGEQGAGGIELLAAEHIVVALAGDPCLEFQGVLAAAFGTGIADSPAVEHRFEQQVLLPFTGSAFEQLQDAELVLRDLPQRRVGGADDAKHFGDGDKRHLGTAVGAGNGNAAQAAAGELFDFCPGQLALLVAPGSLAAGNFGQFTGSLQGLGVTAQDLGRQQQRGAVEITVDVGICQTGHQCRSLAALNALALRTGVIVFLTITLPHVLERSARAAPTEMRWSGGPVHIP